MTYQVFPALHEEASIGWIWVSGPQLKRQIVRIVNTQTRMPVFCEYRLVDENFREYYNSRPRTMQIPAKPADENVVISHWYRCKLGIKETERSVDLAVTTTNWYQCASIRAGLQHPDAIVRLATYLGVISCALGILGFLLGLLSLVH
jgi:hypothetical protein